MTVMAKPLSGAPSTSSIISWKDIDWQKMTAQVRRLQMRIAKAYREKKHGKVKALQWILTHSLCAKLLATKRVTQNRGSKTPGIDNIIWNTPELKIQAALSLKRKGYQTKPLKRIYIPKKQKGKLRPLSIPVMQCRAQQAIHLLSLEPIAETSADKNAYGFRPLRSTADAIQRCFNVLVRKNSAQYILEGDIQGCFDNISHQWLRENTHMDREMLRKWLDAGHMEKRKLHPTIRGTPQGGIISPTLLNVTLSGMEQAIQAATKHHDKVHVCVYADDFIVTGNNREILESKVKPTIEAFLKGRGLALSQEKTKITTINEGFDFLGMNIRKYNSKLIIKPAKNSVKHFLATIREIIKNSTGIETENLIKLLNSKIRGWANYYRHVCSSKTFGFVDHEIFKALWRWALRRHPNKGAKWVQQKYFRKELHRNWIFSCVKSNKTGKTRFLDLTRASQVPIRRHNKIKAAAIPFDPAYQDYFDKRLSKYGQDKDKIPSSSLAGRWLCWWKLSKSNTMGGKAGSRVAL